MGYNILVTFDLPLASTKQRDIFYKYLEENKWTRIKQLTTAWVVIFEDGVTENSCINIVKSELNSAKELSEIKKVEFAMQLSLNAIIIKTI